MANSEYIEDIVSHSAETGTYIKAYLRKQVEYHKLEAYEKASEAGAVVTSYVTTLTVAYVAIVFLSIALALWLGSVIGSPSLGFVCVAGVYLVVLLLIRLFRKSFRASIQDRLIAFLTADRDA